MRPEDIGDPEGLLKYRIQELEAALAWIDEMLRVHASAVQTAPHIPPRNTLTLIGVQVDKIRRIVADQKQEHP